MSKINCEFKYRELQAIKHALELQISSKEYYDAEKYYKDIEQEKKILEYVIEKIINKR